MFFKGWLEAGGRKIIFENLNVKPIDNLCFKFEKEMQKNYGGFLDAFV